MKIKIKEFELKGIAETYSEQIWVKDDNHPSGKGGSDQAIVKYHDSPVADIDVVLEVTGDVLVTGGIYRSNNGESYVALSGYTLRNACRHVRSFKCPESLGLVGSTFAEGSENP